MDIKDILLKFSELEVLVVGDLMIDQYINGAVTRVSPEAPVPIVEWEGEECRMGGAANVAQNVAALGANAQLCGAIGKDKEGEAFLRLMNENQLNTSLILQSDTRQTTLKTRVLANDQQLLRLDKESKYDLTDGEAQFLVSGLNEYFSNNKVDLCILQDYNKGVLTKRVIATILQLGKKLEVPIAVDPKFNNFWEYKEVQLFKPNLKEIQNMLPFAIGPSKGLLEKGADYIRERLGNVCLLVTLSEHGLFISFDNLSFIYPTSKRQVADVCGAGDAVIAMASMAMSIGLGKEEMALLSNLVGGQVVEKVGVVPIDREQLEQEVRRA